MKEFYRNTAVGSVLVKWMQVDRLKKGSFPTFSKSKSFLLEYSGFNPYIYAKRLYFFMVCLLPFLVLE